MRNFFATRWGIIVVGAVIGIVAAVLQMLGNPPNMGLCMACFERDIAGALGLHSAAVVQYIRPEIIGIILGSFLVSLFTREFKTRGGSAPVIRFFLGVFAMIGALVFLGCPWRAFLRLAGGDWNAILGIFGLAAGVYAGTLFLRGGYNLGRATESRKSMPGWVLPAFAVVVFLMFLTHFPGLRQSVEGPGSKHAAVWLSLAAGLLIGVLAQRSRFCTMGSLRDIFIVRDFHLFGGVAAFTVAAFVMNLLFGQFHPGFAGQPVAHTMHLWNFLGMALAGLAFALAGGCPGRQLILSGEGNGDAGVFVLGMLVGAAFAHNFSLAASPTGIGMFSAWGTFIGLAYCLVVGFAMMEKRKA